MISEFLIVFVFSSSTLLPLECYITKRFQGRACVLFLVPGPARGLLEHGRACRPLCVLELRSHMMQRIDDDNTVTDNHEEDETGDKEKQMRKGDVGSKRVVKTFGLSPLADVSRLARQPS